MTAECLAALALCLLACSAVAQTPPPATSASAAPPPTPPSILNVTAPLWEYRLAAAADGTPATATTGVLAVRPVATAPWGAVCDDFFDHADAAVACRSLGLPGDAATFSRASIQAGAAHELAGAPRYVTDVSCAGDEPRLDACRLVTGAAPNATGAMRSGVACAGSAVVALSCTEGAAPPWAGWQMRLVGGTAAGRATRNGSAWWGRLEARDVGRRGEAASSVPWGTVCDDGFDVAAARVACRSMGLPYDVVAWRTAREAAERGREAQPIALDDVACRGTEASVGECGRAAEEDCGHQEDVVLTCGAAAVPAPLATGAGHGANLVGPEAAGYNGTLATSHTCDETCIFAFLVGFAVFIVFAGSSCFCVYYSLGLLKGRFAPPCCGLVCVAFIAFVASLALFWVGMLNPGLEYRPIFADAITAGNFTTVAAQSCDALGGKRQAYTNPCDSDEFALVGTSDETLSKRCCTPVHPGKCEALSSALKITPTSDRGDAACCPRIAGGRVPQAFGVLFLAGLVAVFTKLLTNLLGFALKVAWRRIQKARNKVTEDQELGAPLNGTALLRGIFGVSNLIIATTSASFVIGYVASIVTTVTADAPPLLADDGWMRYNLFASTFLGGGGFKAIVAALSLLFVELVAFFFGNSHDGDVHVSNEEARELEVATLGNDSAMYRREVDRRGLEWAAHLLAKQVHADVETAFTDKARYALEDTGELRPEVESLLSDSDLCALTKKGALSLPSAAAQKIILESNFYANELRAACGEEPSESNTESTAAEANGNSSSDDNSNSRETEGEDKPPASAPFKRAFIEREIRFAWLNVVETERKQTFVKRFASFVVLPMLIAASPVIVTHVLPGLCFYLPFIALVAMIGCCVMTGWTVMFNGCVKDMALAAALYRLLFLIMTDILFSATLRIPGEWSVVHYGFSDMPYVTIGTGAQGNAAIAGTWHVPFYYMQMASPTCFFRTAFESADMRLQTVLTWVT